MKKRNYKIQGLETASKLNANVNKMTSTKYDETPGLEAASKINKNIAKMSKVKKVGIKVPKY